MICLPNVVSAGTINNASAQQACCSHENIDFSRNIPSDGDAANDDDGMTVRPTMSGDVTIHTCTTSLWWSPLTMTP